VEDDHWSAYGLRDRGRFLAGFDGELRRGVPPESSRFLKVTARRTCPSWRAVMKSELGTRLDNPEVALIAAANFVSTP